ncbi:hypothetical protein AGMMS50229_19060 [Campylobacterota bacterium]|nr:hypothetical protein AGMMS50229_19060 [Campylobacterota bacterium]
MKQGIVKRLVIMGCVSVVCTASLLIAAILLNQKGIIDGFVINIAGRERMLTQKISKEVFILNSQDSINFGELNQAMIEFQSGLNILRFGDEQYSYTATSNEVISAQLDTITQKWTDYSESVTVFIATMSAVNVHKTYLDRYNQEMLQRSAAIAEVMVKHNLSAEDIYDAGELGMLTQKMAYRLIRYNNIWDRQSFQDFSDAHDRYSKTLARFAADGRLMKLPDVRRAIDAAAVLWQEYSRHAIDLTHDEQTLVGSLVKIVNQNIALLNEIEIAVGLYEVESVSIRRNLYYVQIAAAVILSLLTLYAISVLKSIKSIFDHFVQNSEELAHTPTNAANIEKLRLAIASDDQTELATIYKNISIFLENINTFENNSQQVIKQNEQLSQDITEIADGVFKSIKNLKIPQEEKEKIIRDISLSEDIAIQTQDYIISSSQLWQKIKQRLLSSAAIMGRDHAVELAQ